MLGGTPDGSPLRFALRAQLRDDPSGRLTSQPKCQHPPGVQAIGSTRVSTVPALLIAQTGTLAQATGVLVAGEPSSAVHRTDDVSWRAARPPGDFQQRAPALGEGRGPHGPVALHSAIWEGRFTQTRRSDAQAQARCSCPHHGPRRRDPHIAGVGRSRGRPTDRSELLRAECQGFAQQYGGIPNAADAFGVTIQEGPQHRARRFLRPHVWIHAGSLINGDAGPGVVSRGCKSRGATLVPVVMR